MKKIIIILTVLFTINLLSAQTYRFHEDLEKAGTVTINGKNYDLVTFGDWPQTIKDDSVTIDENKYITMGCQIYYTGSDGNYYAKVREAANTLSYAEKSLRDAHPGIYYSNGKKVAKKVDGEIYSYFKVEPIVWRVVTEKYTNGKALLLAEKVLTGNISFINFKTEVRNVDGQYVYANNYEYSQLRAYLNGLKYPESQVSNNNKWENQGFLQSAFTEKGQRLIAVSSVDNSVDSAIDYTKELDKPVNFVCRNTDDKVFAMSINELTNPDYGFNHYSNFSKGNARKKIATDYALATGAYQDTNRYGYSSEWTTRSPGCSKDLCRQITPDGYGEGKEFVNRVRGVVPAITIEYLSKK